MFFPKLTRSPMSDYFSSRGGTYADYRRNKVQVSLDCKGRCVYCDILLEEIGGEGMHLDHFRPIAHFPKLETDPYNLMLACPKCNVLKSDDWPCDKNKNKPSFEGSIGYLDPFENGYAGYLEVNTDGEIVGVTGPIDYMIDKMLLNRLSRVQIRRRRVLQNKKAKLSGKITELMADLLTDMENNAVTMSQATSRLKELQEYSNGLQSM